MIHHYVGTFIDISSIEWVFSNDLVGLIKLFKCVAGFFTVLINEWDFGILYHDFPLRKVLFSMQNIDICFD